MGCDIHAYIEFGEDMSKSITIKSLGEIYIPRNYLLFALLAGVRSDGTTEPIIPPRGFPDPASFVVLYEYTEYVDPEERDRVAKDKSTRWWDKDTWCIIRPDWHTPSWLTANELRLVKQAFQSYQDMNTADDELPAEYDLVITNRGVMRGKRLGAWPWPIEMDAVLAAMAVLPNARLVFWFDN